MSKKCYLRGTLNKQHGERAQTLLKYPSQHLYHIPSSLSRKLCSKKALLLTCQILGLLVNTLASDEIYPVLNREKLPIKMQLSQKQITFSQFCATFLKSTFNFEYFEKKDDPDSFSIFEIMDSGNVVR